MCGIRKTLPGCCLDILERFRCLLVRVCIRVCVCEKRTSYDPTVNIRFGGTLRVNISARLCTNNTFKKCRGVFLIIQAVLSVCTFLTACELESQLNRFIQLLRKVKKKTLLPLQPHRRSLFMGKNSFIALISLTQMLPDFIFHFLFFNIMAP